LIRLARLRPRFMPGRFGLASENAAHRIAVEWTVDGRPVRGVYIPRRDTDSRLSTVLGGRVFPGVHHHARFTVREVADRLSIRLESDDGHTRVDITARPVQAWSASRLFDSLCRASAFFERGSIGYSPGHDPHRCDGVELRCERWSVRPLQVEQVESSFFDDLLRFPRGTAEFDHALLMRGIEHEWHACPALCHQTWSRR
jgi:hypothetical protein